MCGESEVDHVTISETILLEICNVKVRTSGFNSDHCLSQNKLKLSLFITNKLKLSPKAQVKGTINKIKRFDVQKCNLKEILVTSKNK